VTVVALPPTVIVIVAPAAKVVAGGMASERNLSAVASWLTSIA
jgi:hypothetical protein